MIIVNGKEIECVVLNGEVCPMYLNGQLITPSEKEENLSITIGYRKYKVIDIGTQLWMAENLDWRFNGLTYRDGTTNNTLNASTSVPQAAYYNYDNQTYGYAGNKFGLLYNWAAANYLNQHLEELNVPEGWEVPKSNDFNKLCDAVGYGGETGKKLKSKPPVFDGTDEIDFDFLPAGYWSYSFNGLNNYGELWTSEEYNSTSALYKQTYRSNDGFWNTTTYKYTCMSIRLVKNLT